MASTITSSTKKADERLPVGGLLALAIFAVVAAAFAIGSETPVVIVIGVAIWGDVAPDRTGRCGRQWRGHRAVDECSGVEQSHRRRGPSGRRAARYMGRGLIPLGRDGARRHRIPDRMKSAIARISVRLPVGS